MVCFMSMLWRKTWWSEGNVVQKTSPIGIGNEDGTWGLLKGMYSKDSMCKDTQVVLAWEGHMLRLGRGRAGEVVGGQVTAVGC